MKRLAHLALRAVARLAGRALATRIDPVMVAPEPEPLVAPEPERVWDEAMDGPAPVFPNTWRLTPDEQLHYHATACEYVEHEANLRAAHHAADFEAWRAEVMAS